MMRRRITRIIVYITALVGIFAALYYVLRPPVEIAPNPQGEYVIILHGIARSSKHMEELALYLARNGYDVINLDYPSTSHTLQELRDIVVADIKSRVKDGKTVHFVGYSMGGLVVRAVLQEYRPDKLGRVVQLASPNHGSEVADFLRDNMLYKEIYGPAGQELVTGNTRLQELLGTPYYELGVIAGSATIDPLSSYIIPGDDDGKVAIRNTKIDGMSDHIVIDASHTLFPYNTQVHMQTLHFIRNGRFRREAQ